MGTDVRVVVNGQEREIEPGVKMSRLVEMMERDLDNEPMINSLKENTGKSHLIFVHNGRVVSSEQCATIEICENDEVRMIHPFFGG